MKEVFLTKPELPTFSCSDLQMKDANVWHETKQSTAEC